MSNETNTIKKKDFITENRKVPVYDIYIGVNSNVLKKECESVEWVAKTVCNYLCKNKEAFSMTVQDGGYTVSSGHFLNERGVKLTFADGDYDAVLRICKTLKMLLEQESVLITRRYVEVMYL